MACAQGEHAVALLAYHAASTFEALVRRHTELGALTAPRMGPMSKGTGYS